MAFTRKFLKSLGLTDDQIEAVVEAHTEVTDAQKLTIAELAEKVSHVDELQAKVDELTTDDWKGKYSAKDKEFRDYKATVEAKEKESAVKAAYRALLVGEKVGERQLDAVMRATDFKSMKLGADGALEDVDTLKANIKRDWGGFIVTESEHGAKVPNPPDKDNSGGANPRAAELAKRFQAQRYGEAPAQPKGNESNT